jgi:zinc protease
MKTLRAALLLAVCFIPVALRAADRLEVPYQMFRLANGLTVIVHEDHSVPVVSVNTWYHVGSSREKPGRTGLAHLFEHIMFEGSKNVPNGAFHRMLEAVGGTYNGTTSEDRTNYFEDVPANVVELPLFLESDRMGHLLETLTPERVDGQRDVVKNERRERIENAPYGMADIFIDQALYPADHPYHWPVIGYMDDLTAATHEDIKDFFRRYYAPGNASLVIAGDIDAKESRRLATKWYGEIPAGPPVEPLGTRPVVLEKEKRLVYEDNVQLPRLYLTWPTAPYLAAPDAALDALGGVLAGGKNSRLYKRLVYDEQIAQDVSASQQSAALTSAFGIVVTARAGHTLEEMRKVIDAEIERMQTAPPTDRELMRFQNSLEASYLTRLEKVSGKANQLNNYFVAAGDPDFFEEDLARYRALSPSDVQAVANRYLGGGRIALSVVPTGQRALALGESEVVK